MPTIPGGTLSVVRSDVVVYADNSAVLTIVYTNVGNTVVHVRRINIGAQVVDQYGNVLANPTPPALANAITAFASQIDTTITNAAGAGKLNL